MKSKALLYLTLCLSFMTCLLIYPSNASEGVKHGLRICATVIIPSLFPFTVVSLILFDVDLSVIANKRLNKICKVLFGLNVSQVYIFILSLLGGFPVGAKLIDSSYRKNMLSKKNAELMLGYCVNSGPAFIVLVVGSALWGNKKLGMLLLFASVLASLLIAAALAKSMDDISANESIIKKQEPFSDLFVRATYNATDSIFRVCGSVVIFSTIISLIEPLLTNCIFGDKILSILEITNGIIISKDNIYMTAFIIGFGGISVHFQVISVCTSIKIKYYKFFIFRILHGVLTTILLSILLKIFKVSISTIGINNEFSLELTKYSVTFSIMLIICAVIFMSSVNKSNNLE